MIICMVCKTNMATVHLTDLLNKTEVHLCEECAQKQGAATQNSLLPDILATIQSATSSADQDAASLKCAKCGMTYAEFRRTGRLGCARDYEVFREALLPLIERIHGAREHMGRVPQSSPEQARRSSEVVALRRKLEAAIRAEDYERAAQVRDQLRKLDAEADDSEEQQ